MKTFLILFSQLFIVTLSSKLLSMIVPIPEQEAFYLFLQVGVAIIIFSAIADHLDKFTLGGIHGKYK